MDSLNNIKILDFTQAMAGPIATMILSDLGAEVIKVEPLNGEQSRHWAPPYINKESAYYLSLNRNKKSIAIDLKNNDSKEIIKKLVENSDIIIENFKPDIPEKLNIDYNTLKNYNDKIIYCSISGYGNNGPYKDYPAYDLTILARSGLMSITGEENGNPVRFGVPISDITTGLFSDISILSALHYRDLYNKGQYIDLSMLDVNAYLLLNQFMNYLATGKNPEKEGSKHPSIAPYEVFKTKDNYIAIAVGTEKLWNNLCRALNLNINNYNEFNSNENRIKNRDKLENILNDVFIKYNTYDIYNILIKYGIPCSPVNKISDVINDEQIKYRDMIKTLDAPYGKISLLNSPFKMSETPGRINNYPPELGENTIDILKSLNFSEEQIKDFIKNNVVK